MLIETAGRSAATSGRAPGGGAIAADVMPIVLETAARSIDERTLVQAAGWISRQTGAPASVRWNPIGLSLGPSGQAIMAQALNERLPDRGWDRRARRLLAEAARHRPPDLSLFGGLTGLAAASAIVGDPAEPERKRFEELDRLLLAQIAWAAANLPRRPPLGDVGVGVSGWSAYLRLRPREFSAESGRLADLALEAVGTALVDLLAQRDGIPVLAMLPDQMHPEMRPIAPRGYVAAGLAHGVAGPLAALALLRLDGRQTPDGTLAALRWGVDWLLERQLKDTDDVGWNRLIDLGDGRGAIESSAAERPSWCYGTPGIARALWLAGRALGDKECQQVALQAMGAVTRRGLEELPGSGLCHGLAGLLITTRLFEHETGDPRWRADRLHLVGSLIERYEPETRLGYVDIERNGAEVDNPGLLSGTAGVVLAVLAATSSQIPTWVRLLSLA